MCMLTVLPMPELLTTLTQQRLRNGSYHNNDGHGWAAIVDGKLVAARSMKFEDALDSFKEAYEHATGPALFHSRWATHGSESVDNCHPFPVAGMGKTVVAHNGVLPVSAWPAEGDDRSDTRVFADDILPTQYARLDRARVRKALGTWLGSNKIAILTTNPKLRRNLYLFNQDLGRWEDGVWFSNSDYEAYNWSKFSQPVTSMIDNDCTYCHAHTVNNLSVCETCGTCQECWEPQRECVCYQSGEWMASQADADSTVGTSPSGLSLAKALADRNDGYATVLGPIGFGERKMLTASE